MPAAAILVACYDENKGKRRAPPPILKRGQDRQWFLLQLSGWLNVVFLLAVAGSLFCIPYLLGDDPAIPALLCFNNQVYQFWGVIWAITAVAGAVYYCAGAGVGFEC